MRMPPDPPRKLAPCGAKNITSTTLQNCRKPRYIVFCIARVLNNIHEKFSR